MRSKTHCKNGHAFSPENTYVYPNGERECRTCQRARKRERYHADLEASRARERDKARRRAQQRRETLV